MKNCRKTVKATKTLHIKVQNLSPKFAFNDGHKQDEVVLFKYSSKKLHIRNPFSTMENMNLD